jgi:protein TonB
MKSKTKKSDLEGKKPLFLQIGLVVALSLALVAFEWTSEGNIKIIIPPQNDDFIEDLIPPTTNPQDIKKPAPPTPIINPQIIIVEPDITKLMNLDPSIFDEPEIGKFTPIAYEPEPEVDEVVDFVVIENKPTFMGGDEKYFSKWVAKNIVYPQIAVDNDIQGRVFVEFVIDVDGSITEIKVLRSDDESLKQEALRVLGLSPKWEPGKQRQKPTKVRFTFPFVFKLNGN